MNVQIKKIFSVFFLILFLFPLMEKGIHDANHLDDAHCIATDKHFHTLEHNCPICDFTVTNHTFTPETSARFIIFVQHFSFVSLNEKINTEKVFHLFPSRAPPVV